MSSFEVCGSEKRRRRGARVAPLTRLAILSMEEDEQLLVAHEWEACGEGARNVVLRYTGSQAPLVRPRAWTHAGCASALVLPRSPGAPASATRWVT
jgi:hypothetical protein